MSFFKWSFFDVTIHQFSILNSTHNYECLQCTVHQFLSLTSVSIFKTNFKVYFLQSINHYLFNKILLLKLVPICTATKTN